MTFGKVEGYFSATLERFNVVFEPKQCLSLLLHMLREIYELRTFIVYFLGVFHSNHSYYTSTTTAEVY
jgi:hypothetical protein